METTAAKKTFLADLGWGTTYRVKSLQEARADKQTCGCHEFHDGKHFRTVWFANRTAHLHAVAA